MHLHTSPGGDLPAGLAPDEGLSAAQVKARQRLGANDIVGEARAGWAQPMRDTLRDPMPWLLVGTAAVFGLAGQTGDAWTLLAAVVPLIAMDAFLHQRTHASTAGLSRRLATRCRVLREGIWSEIPSRELVPGDLVELAPGGTVPADGLVMTGREIQVDESMLTGESMPVVKTAWTAGKNLGPEDDGAHAVLAGTRLLTGQARVRIVAIGRETRYGAIVRAAIEGSHEPTPLQQAIARLVRWLLAMALLLCAALAGIRLAQGHGAMDAWLSAVTLAVAALPEEFPLVYTFFLGLGVYRMARRKALVRRAVAVENIGRVTCIATDKTGTLTAGELTLAHRLPAPGEDADSLLRVAASASRTDSSDPLDRAILATADDTAPGASAPAMTPASGTARGECLAVFPFTEQRRRETAVWKQADGTLLATCKGAPETVLALCTLEAGAAGPWSRAADGLAQAGHKVIACASRKLPAGPTPTEEPDQGFSLSGLLAFEDPVREGVREAVTECLAAGLQVVMVTGDHPGTARAIAREIGLGDGEPRVLTLQSDDDATAAMADAEGVDVFARATPEHKLALVQALQARGETVAVTGDGVNDVPALRQADIGIAMGSHGTTSAQEVAPVVLLDDNFRTIVRAMAEGHLLFEALRASFAYLLLVHIPLVLSAALVPLLSWPLLYLPIHVAWLELVIHPTAILAFHGTAAEARMRPAQPVQAGRGSRRGTSARPSRPASFFDSKARLAIALTGGLVTAAVLGATHLAQGHATADDDPMAHARAMAVAMLVCASAAAATGLSGLRTPAARWVTGMQLATLAALVQQPALSHLMHLQPLHAADWALVAALGAATAMACRWLVAPGLERGASRR